MKLGKINYVITDFETTGLPEEDERHRPYQWAWKMLVVDFEARTVVVISERCEYIDPGVPDLIVSEYTRNSQCWKNYVDTRTFEPHRILNPLALYKDFVHVIMKWKERGYAPFQVGANPGFDRQFIDHFQHEAELKHGMKHRMWDTDQIAAHALGLPYPIGLEESIRRLYDKPCFEQRHEADVDVSLCERILVDHLINPLLNPEGKHLLPANP